MLEKASEVDTVIFDKTGTLSSARLSLIRACIAAAHSEDELLAVAAAAEASSEHPIGRAILQEAKARNLILRRATSFRVTAGQGISCRLPRADATAAAARDEAAREVSARGSPAEALEMTKMISSIISSTVSSMTVSSMTDRSVLVGNRDWLSVHCVSIGTEHEARASAMEDEGLTVAFVAVDGALYGVLAIGDSVRVEAHAVVRHLRRRRVDVWMLTGDSERTARRLAGELGIEHVLAGIKPAGKAEHVAALQRQGRTVAMVGDGINDAPALAQADVGIAIGSGTDVAIETADVVLVKSNLRDVCITFHLAQAVMRRIRLNFIWAFGYNLIGLPVAAGVFYPSFGVQLPPMFAGLAMALSSVSVVCSSLLLRCYTPPDIHDGHSGALCGCLDAVYRCLGGGLKRAAELPLEPSSRGGAGGTDDAGKLDTLALQTRLAALERENADVRRENGVMRSYLSRVGSTLPIEPADMEMTPSTRDPSLIHI